MTKVRKNFTIDVETFEQFRLEVENMSQEVERFMEARVNGKWEDDNDKGIKEKIDEYERKLEEIEKQKQEIREKEQRFQARISSLEARKKQQEQEKAEEEEGWIEVNQEVDA